jgi:riboflavin kinase/FMN adenylyltransferase
MRIFRHTSPLPAEARGSVAAVGNFDGVHRGHRSVLAETCRIAARLKHACALLTFEPHPRAFFFPERPPFRLTPLRIKAHCVEALGVDYLFVLHFDAALAALPPEAFVKEILVDGMGIAHAVVGYDFVFGKGRAGNAATLAALGRRYGFGVTEVAPAKGEEGEVFSSTRIREHLAAGRPAEAARLLGRCWEIEGRVVPGAARGRELGVPTANLGFDDYLRPAHGIYAVRAGVDHGTQTHWHDAVASFGTRPAVGGGAEVFEVHLLDFSGDLYGKHLRVALVEYLRPESDFESLEALTRQMRLDCGVARRVLDERRGSIRVAERPAGLCAPAPSGALS